MMGHRLGLLWRWMVSLGNKPISFSCFLRFHPSTAYQTLVDYEDYPISFKVFLPTAVNIMVIWIKIHPFLSISVHGFLRYWYKSYISCLTMYNLPWFMDLTFQVPMQYCSVQHWNWFSSVDTSTTEHLSHVSPATWFFLELLLIVLHSSPVAYWTF